MKVRPILSHELVVGDYLGVIFSMHQRVPAAPPCRSTPVHGTTRAGHLFLGSGRPIWNNDGDTATLIDLATSK
jgi:hypothetical protein